MNHTETLAVLGLMVPSTSPMLRAYTALATAQQEVCCRLATDDIDACHWIGTPTGDEHDEDDFQEHAFPRIGITELEREATIPAGAAFTAWSTPLIPGNIRTALAVQAAVHAMIAMGYAFDDWPEGSGGPAARHPWARLHPKAQTAARRFRRSTFAGV
jgi:hypothetical protein